MTEPQQHVPGTVIAVLGGGYAGLFAAHRAARAITKARHSGAAVVLIDSDHAWQGRTRWHQVAAGETVRSHSRARIFRGTQVATITGTVTGIDLEDRKLTFSDRAPLVFGRLVYAAGSRSNAASVPGAAAHAHTLDTAQTSTRLAAAIAEHPGSSVLIVGGGLTGIQTAAQIARRHPKVHVTLASSGPIGRELPGAARARAVRALTGLGVEIVEQCRVEAVEPGSVRWSGGRIAADLVVWTAGFVPSPLAEQAGLVVTGTGQIVVDTALRSVSHPILATSLGPGNAVVQLLRPDGTPRRQIIVGRAGNALKETVEHYVTFGITAERTIPGVYHWAPGPKTRTTDATAQL